ncbi:MAG: hypothetical protein KAJ11_12440, partial [Alphaproteobacteria bacterium]|nr:hypothetical protein [Alphaproteobacteria bacterium]
MACDAPAFGALIAAIALVLFPGWWMPGGVFLCRFARRRTRRSGRDPGPPTAESPPGGENR